MIFFDLDGTLADTLADISASMNRALGSYGFAGHSPEAYRYFVGDGIEAVARRILPPGEAGRAADIVAAFRSDYAQHLLDSTRLYEGVPELLDELAARGEKLAIVSNKPERPARQLARALCDRWPFLAVHGQSEDWPLKPDPTLTLALARAAGAAPHRCLFVGDSNVDMLTARGAGMHPVGVLWGFREAAEPAAAGAEALIARPGELLALLDKLPHDEGGPAPGA
jgi:phosphoglycolate phosphatase